MIDNDELLKIVRDHVTRLSEHFSTVEIFVTRDPVEVGDNAGDTVAMRAGSGNWYARLGQIEEFVREQDAKARANAVREDE